MDSNSQLYFIPFLAFVGIAILATYLQVRRRQRLQRNGHWPPPHPSARRNNHNNTNPPASWLGGIRSGGRRQPAGEEGLNELGEAPPPYDPKKKKEDVDIEMAAGGADPPGYADAVTPGVGGAVMTPAGEGSEVRPPPPVVTR